MQRLLGFTFFLVAAAPAPAVADWLQFRGDNASTSVAAEGIPPVEWSATKNVAWKADLAGVGLSTPIVVGDQVLVSAADGHRQDRLLVSAYDVATGERRWERGFYATGRTLCHETSRVAAPTPASDGKFVYVLYSSNDLACFGLNGELQWLRGLMVDYANVSNSLGMASSPTVVDGVVVVQLDNDSESIALGVDAATGQDRWKVDRPAKANWASPVVVKTSKDGPSLVVMQASSQLDAYEPKTGKLVWSMELGCSAIPSLTAVDGKLYVPAGGLTALDLDAAGGPPKSLWSAAKSSPSTPSPVVYRGKAFTVGRNGVLTAAAVDTGETAWQLRLKGPFSG
ncbi:MAG: PQQ-binding-like beta-propeller repeat protein, partial [Planctomycetia bacterium]